MLKNYIWKVKNEQTKKAPHVKWMNEWMNWVLKIHMWKTNHIKIT